jgi:threonine/homoserine/homoserine lactone efflux protein
VSWTSYGAYLLIVVGLVLMPGPDTFVMLRASLVGGRAGGLSTLAGVVYLCVLGVQALRAARRGDYPVVPDGGPRVPARRSFLVGFGSNITNPKVLVMYLSVLPQFLVPGVTTTADALLLALSVAVLGGVYGVGLVLAVHRARAFFTRRRVRRAGDVVAGVALIGFGGALAAA